MRELGLAEPVAVTLVRRGYRTVEQARDFLAAADDHDPFLFEAMAEVVRADPSGDRRRAPDHGPRRLRRGRRLLDRDPGPRPAGAGCRLRLADPGPARGRLRAHGVDRGEAGRARHVAADHDRLRDRLGRRGRGRARGGARGDRHRPPPARRAAARAARSCIPSSPAIRSASSARPASPTSSRSPCAGAEAVAPELDLVALATVADLVPLRGENRALVRRGLAEARRARRPGLRALMARRRRSRPSASTRAISPSGSGRGSTPPAASTGPTPGSS